MKNRTGTRTWAMKWKLAPATGPSPVSTHNLLAEHNFFGKNSQAPKAKTRPIHQAEIAGRAQAVCDDEQRRASEASAKP